MDSSAGGDVPVIAHISARVPVQARLHMSKAYYTQITGAGAGGLIPKDLPSTFLFACN
jgi:hypothetical protein